MKKYIIRIIPVAFILCISVLLLLYRPVVLLGRNAGNAVEKEGVLLATQFPVYDKSCESVTLIIENNSGHPIEFGRPWSLEKKVLGQWSSLVPKTDLAFTMEAIAIESRSALASGRWAQECRITEIYGTLTDGEYRIIKEIDNEAYAASFSIGSSTITSATLYGHEPLENLSLRPFEIPVNNAVMTEQEKLHNGEELRAFLEAWQTPGMGYQMRMAYRGDEGHVVIEDVTLLRDNKILWQCDVRRAPNGSLYSHYYSNIVTDGERLYLSDWNEYRGDGSERVLLNFTLPEKEGKEAVSLVQNTPKRFRILERWSHDGQFSASLTENGFGFTRYFPQGGEVGSMLQLSQDSFEDTENPVIYDLEWTAENHLLVAAIIDSDTGQLHYQEVIDVKSGKSLSQELS